MHISGHLLPPGSASGSGIAVWEESGACGHGEPPSWTREAEANSAALVVLRSPPSDPPAPHYDGAALDGWRRDGRRPDAFRPARGWEAQLRQAWVRHRRPGPMTSAEVLGQKSLRGTPGVPAS